jgi:hypothetical protein
MAKYFSKFPKLYYSLRNDGLSVDVVTNLIARFSLEKSLKENTSTYYEYLVKDGDTPEILASKIYSSPERHWIILLMNDIIDPQFDWPLDYRSFNEFVEGKYSTSEYSDKANTNNTGVSWAQSNVYGYYKVVTITTTNGVSDKKTIKIDQAQYTNLSTSNTTNTLSDNNVITISVTKESKTYYEYENDLNENKRIIKILKPEFVPGLEDEFSKIVNG